MLESIRAQRTTNNSQSLKNIKTKKSYTTNESDNKIIQKFYPQSTTNKENKPIEFDSHTYSHLTLEDNKQSQAHNKHGLKSYNYHANYTQGSAKTPSNKSQNQNFSIKYQLVKKSQNRPSAKRVSEYSSSKSKSTQRQGEAKPNKKNSKSISSYSSKSISLQKSKQKLSREKIKFKDNPKVYKDFQQSKIHIGMMMPPKTQREMQSFFNASTQVAGEEGYSCDISALGKSDFAGK